MILENGPELGPTVDLDASDLKGRAGDEFVEQVPCGASGCGAGDVADGPFGDRIVGGEGLDRFVGGVDEQGVDLDEFAGRFGFRPLARHLA